MKLFILLLILGLLSPNPTESLRLLYWGANGVGQSGINSTTPTTITSANPATPLTDTLLSELGTELNGLLCTGNNFSVAATVSNQLLGWGSNVFGNLAVDPTVLGSTRLPVLMNTSTLPPAEDIVGLQCGANNVGVLMSDGSLWFWGRGDIGTIGNGLVNPAVVWTPTRVNQTDPTGDGSQVLFIDDFGFMQTSGAFARDLEGRIFTWGINTAGRLCQDTAQAVTYIALTPGLMNSTAWTSSGESVFDVSSVSNAMFMITNLTRRVFVCGSNSAAQFGGGGSDVNPHSDPRLLLNSPFDGTTVFAFRVGGVGSGASGNIGFATTNISATAPSRLYRWETFVPVTLGAMNFVNPIPGFTLIPNEWVFRFTPSEFVIGVMDAYGNRYAATANLPGNPTSFTVLYWTAGLGVFQSMEWLGTAIMLTWDPSLVPNTPVSNPGGWPVSPEQSVYLSSATPITETSSTSLLSADEISPVLMSDQVEAGLAHSLILLNDGRVLAQGDNTYGQLGWGSGLSSSDIYVEVDFSGVGSPVIVKIAAGYNHNLALSDTGAVYCWGRNQVSQCGNQAVTDPVVYTPILVNMTGQTVASPLTLEFIAAGNDASTAVSIPISGVNYAFAWGNAANFPSCTTVNDGTSYVSSGTVTGPVPVRQIVSAWPYPFTNLGSLLLADFRRQTIVDVKMGAQSILFITEGPYLDLRNVYGCGQATGQPTSCLGTVSVVALRQLTSFDTFTGFNPVQVSIQSVSTNSAVTLITGNYRYTGTSTNDGLVWGCGTGSLFNNASTGSLSTPYLFIQNGIVGMNTNLQIWKAVAGPSYSLILGYNSSYSLPDSLPGSQVSIFSSSEYQRIPMTNSSREIAAFKTGTTQVWTSNWPYNAVPVSPVAPPSSGGGLSPVAIVFIVLGAVVLVLFLGILAWFNSSQAAEQMNRRQERGYRRSLS